MIKVLFVLPSFAGGGAERVALTLLAGLDRTRFAPTLVVFDAHGPLMDMVPADVSVISLSRPRLRSALPALIGVIRTNRPDVVFSTLGYVNLALLAFRTLLSAKTCVVVREANMPSLSLPATKYPTLYRLSYRLLYRFADAVVCTSQKMRSELIRDFAVRPERLALLPNPVDEQRMRRAAVPLVRDAGEGLRLVAAGRLTHQKGFDRLLDMFAQVEPSAHLSILGDGPERESLQRQAQDLGVAERVTFWGFCANPWPHYAGADCVVVPSRWEGLPNVVLESLACGTPVLATPDAGGIADIAAQTQGDSVTIAETGTAFVAALQRMSVSNTPVNAVRTSLLPDAYRVETGVEKFERLLQDVCGVFRREKV